MAQKYQEKPLNFVPTLFRRKFVVPDNPREMGTLVVLFSFAIIMVSAWNGVRDLAVGAGKHSTIGTMVSSAPFRSNNPVRSVGVYIFKDESGMPFPVRGDRVHTNKKKIPKEARVVWPNGRSQKARVVGEYNDYLLGVPVGLAVLGLGIWMRRKRVDRFNEAMQGDTLTQSDTTT